MVGGAVTETVNWLGLAAVYTADDLAVMADLKAGVGAGKVGIRELEVIHEAKALLDARLVEWFEPSTEDASAFFAALTARPEPRNDERAPQPRSPRGPVEGQVSFLSS